MVNELITGGSHGNRPARFAAVSGTRNNFPTSRPVVMEASDRFEFYERGT